MRLLAWGLACAALFVTSSHAAQDTFEECESRARESKQYRCFGEIAGRTGEWQQAHDRLRAIVAQEAENAQAWWALGYAREGLSRQDAEIAYKTAANLFRDQQLHEGEAQVRLYLHSWLWDRGEFEPALEMLRLAESAAASSNSDQLFVQSQLARADIAGQFGRYDEEERVLLSVESRLEVLPIWLQALWAATRGGNLWSQHDLESAAQMFSLAADLRHEEGNFFWEALDRLALAKVAEPTQRLEAYREARRVAALGGNMRVVALADLAIGRADPDVGRGRRLMREAFNRIQALERPLDTQSSAQTLAVDLARREPVDPEGALLWYERALTAGASTGSERAVASVRATRNHDLWTFAAGDPAARAAALQDGFQTLDAIEAVRDLQLDSLIRARSFSAWRLTYDRLVGRVLSPLLEGEAADYAAALEIMERLRARILLDEMDAAQVWRGEQRLGFDQRDELLRKIARARSGLQPALSKVAHHEDGAQELARLKREEQALRQQLVQQDPKFAMLRGAASADLASIQQALSPTEAMLSYQLGEWESEGIFAGGAWVLVLTREAALAYPLQLDEALLKSLESYSVIAASRMRVPEVASAKVYDALLGAAVSQLPASIQRLILIPDKQLHRLPFAGLKAEPGAPPLSSRFALSRSPSATLWLRWKTAAHAQAPRSMLAYAGPQLRPTAALGGPDRVAEFPNLPHATREGQAAVARLKRGAKLHVGAAATEASLKSHDLNDFGILHLAVHTRVDGVRPERSAVLLGAADSDRDDGRLHLDEIAQLRTEGALVVLSACESATGPILESEGVMNFARGFFVAGAHAVVGSLWPVRDDDAAEFFAAFYRRLDAGTTVGEAFRGAQLDRLGAGAPMAAWAGMVLIGDGELRPVSEKEPAFFQPGVISAVLLLLAGLTFGASIIIWRRIARNS